MIMFTETMAMTEFDEIREPKRGSFRVLVVDDNEVDRELTTRYLSAAWPFEHDLVVEGAATGQEALDKLLQSRWTLVLLDWNMPGVDGADVLRHLRQADMRVPVLILTGSAYEDLADVLRQYRVGFLNKDGIDAGRLYRAIAAALLPLT